MWRPIDYRCCECKRIHEEMVWVSSGTARPKSGVFVCPSCEDETTHESVIGLTAPYMGEKVLNPEMYGGTCDTMGAVQHMPLPDLPGQEEHSAKIRKAMSQLPDSASSKERKSVFSEACKDAPSSADYQSLFSKPEYKEVEAVNDKITKENTAKRKRAKAMRRGENVNMRRDKCPGDPNMTA